MHLLHTAEKAGAYLNIHLTHPGAHPPAQPVLPFVTLSRESGTSGSEFAHALAERLTTVTAHPWTVYSGNLIEEMLRANNLPPHLARFLPEDRVSELNASIGEILGVHPNLWSLVCKTTELMRQLARAGHTILLGRGATFATRTIPNGIHVRLIAPPAVRATRAAEAYGTAVEAAALRNAERDAARQRYVRSTFNADVTSPTDYDLLINVAHVPSPCALDLVERLVAARVVVT